MRTRGLENKRRRASGVGEFVLLGHDGSVPLAVATLNDLASFLWRERQGHKHHLHLAGVHKHNLH
jgi:hypothetical protein